MGTAQNPCPYKNGRIIWEIRGLLLMQLQDYA